MKNKKNIIKLGNRIDSAIDSKDIQALKDCISLSQEMELKKNLSNDEKALLFYFMGNAWADLDQLLNYKDCSWLYRRPEFEKAIIYYRKVIELDGLSESTRMNILVQNYTNLGNMFGQAGRIVAAINYWEIALSINENFGMALCNIAHGLIYYTEMLYDESHRMIMLKKAYKLLKNSIDCPSIHENAKNTFQYDIRKIKSILKEEYLESELTFKKFSLGRSKKESEYRTWIIENKLFLNPLNDILNNSVVSHVRIPAYPDSDSEIIRTAFRQHPDTCQTCKILQ